MHRRPADDGARSGRWQVAFRSASAAGIALLLGLYAGGASAATIALNVVDPPDLGFNDTTPATGVAPGNAGATMGERRRVVFQRALEIWQQLLPSDVEIRVQATFAPQSTLGQSMTCTPVSATLGSAGPIQQFRDFDVAGSGHPYANTWYPIALANKLAGRDLTPGEPDGPGGFNDEIISLFNDGVDTVPDCLGGIGFYYGLDHHEEQTGGVDLLAVVTHELGHGLGFFTSVRPDIEGEVSLPGGFPDVFSTHLYDLEIGKTWPEMTTAERTASAINDPYLVWNGAYTTAELPSFLGPEALLVVESPASIAGSYVVIRAGFGPEPALATTNLVAADDGAPSNDGNAQDGCDGPAAADVDPEGGWQTGPWLQSVDGDVALIERGACTFVQKVRNAQALGAVAVVIYNNVDGNIPTLGGSDPAIAIGTVALDRATGLDLAQALAARREAVIVTVGSVDEDNRQGMQGGFIRMYAPDPYLSGGSSSHFHAAAWPDLLMEPFSTGTITDHVDLTLTVMADVGWFEGQTFVPLGGRRLLALLLIGLGIIVAVGGARGSRP